MATLFVKMTKPELEALSSAERQEFEAVVIRL